MENQFYNALPYVHISQACNDALQYIDSRRKGETNSLETRWKKLNKQCMGGIEENSIYTILGISGSGKSAFANILENDLIDLNPGEEVEVLNFTWEMLSSRQVGRKLSAKVKTPTSRIYSVEKKLSDDEFTVIKNAIKPIYKYSIYYVDKIGSVKEFEETVLKFYTNKVKGTGKKFVVMIDQIGRAHV